MEIKGFWKHVPVSTGEESPDDSVPRRRRRSRGKAVMAVATAFSVLVAPALAEADVTAVNQERVEAGLTPVYEDPGLTALAQQQSAQMAATGTLVHSSNLGGEVATVLPSFSSAAENIGLGQSVTSVTNSFMASPTHRSAILGNFNTAGVGVVASGDGRVWVTQVFARTAGGAPAAAPRAASSAAGPAARRAAAGSGRRCGTRTRRVSRRVGGRRVTRVIRTRQCTKRKKARNARRRARPTRTVRR